VELDFHFIWKQSNRKGFINERKILLIDYICKLSPEQ